MFPPNTVRAIKLGLIGWTRHLVRTDKIINIIACISIVRQRVDKLTPETHVHAIIGLMLLGNSAANMPSQQKKRCFVCGPRHAL
jgi:hypothetical protein